MTEEKESISASRFNKDATEETTISSPCDTKLKNATKANIEKTVLEVILS